MRTAKLVTWPMSGWCQSVKCESLHFINAVIDRDEQGKVGANYVCTNEESCPLDTDPRLSDEFIITIPDKEEEDLTIMEAYINDLNIMPIGTTIVDGEEIDEEMEEGI